MGEENISKSICWNVKLEKYFADTGEKASCLSWLHKHAESFFSSKTVFIDLPVIILGVLNGATSIGSKSLFGDSPYASVGVGVVALVTSILTTIGTYFSWARRAEAHKISSIQYGKLYRFLMVELSLPRAERLSPADLLKYVKDQYDRLAEISPLLPKQSIELFRTKFSKAEYEHISKPEETNGLHAIEVYSEMSAVLHTTVITDPLQAAESSLLTSK